MSGRASLASNLVVAGVSLALSLVAAEGTVRGLRLRPMRVANTARIGDPRGRLRLDCYPDNPRGYFDIDLRDLGTRARYLAQGVTRVEAVAARAPFAVEFRFNSLGFRDQEWGDKPPGVRRVIVVGDSFTEGWGVKEADTYPRVLEGRLRAADPGRWEVRNAGKRGADFPALLAQFDQALRHQPDLVVYGMVLNDADRSPEFQSGQAYLNDWILDQAAMVGGRPLHSGGLWRSRLFTLVADRWEAWRIDRASTRWYQQLYAEANRDGWQRTQSHLREIRRRASEQGAGLLVVSWPLLVKLDRYPFAEADEAVARFCREAGLARHDLLPVLRRQPAEALVVHPADRHPNEVAHRLAAESLLPVVTSMLPR